MKMYEVWMRDNSTGNIDKVIYVRANSGDEAFEKTNCFYPAFSNKTVLPEGEWLTEEGGLAKWTEADIDEYIKVTH